MTYNHGVRVQENPTSLPAPRVSVSALQVVFGTAPINLVSDPGAAVNKLMLVHDMDEAKEKLGYSDDFTNYTLCQSMDACFRIFKISPVIFCNVLDPVVHKKSVVDATYPVKDLQAIVNIKGLLLNSLVVKNETVTLMNGEDYLTSFDDDGYAVITLLSTGQAAAAVSLNVSGDKIDPSMVDSADIIGGLDTETGKETGLELVRQVYPRFNLVPRLLLAPGWSHDPLVGAAIAAKTKNINGVFSCENILDIDCTATGATKYTDVATEKETAGYINENSIVLWPQLKIGSKHYAYSAIYAAMVGDTDADNDDIPNLSPSNKLLKVDGAVLADGTEVMLDVQQANVLNASGIVTAINAGGWKAWGNNTACYPINTDPKDRWIACRRFFTWWSIEFILTYFEKVDNPANFRLIEAICDAENIRGNSLVSQGRCAGARIEFNAKDNQIGDILNGKIQFKQYLAPYTPAEDILNVIEFDPTMIMAALGGE
jgi:phage tail sheath protein FI